MDKIKKFVKERDKMLRKCSVDELRKFVSEHEEYYSPMFIDAFARVSDEVVEITLHKMIYHCTNLPLYLREKSVRWLTEHNFDLEV